MEVDGKRAAPAALPRERLCTHYTGGPQGPSGWVRKFLPHRDSIPGPSSPERVAIPTELCRPTRTPRTLSNVTPTWFKYS